MKTFSKVKILSSICTDRLYIKLRNTQFCFSLSSSCTVPTSLGTWFLHHSKLEEGKEIVIGKHAETVGK